VRRAELARVAPGAEVLARLQRGDAQRGREHRHVDVPAGTSSSARDQRGDGVHRVQARHEVGQRHAGLHGTIGLARHAHDACCGLDREVEAAFQGRAGRRWP
jgi:hypothetical protein